MDPNFSVLLGVSQPTDDCDNSKSNPSSSSINKTLLIAVLASVLGAVAIGVLFFTLAYPRLRNYWQVKRASSGIELSDSKLDGSDEQESMVIEKRQDMEVNTASGRFVVKL